MSDTIAVPLDYLAKANHDDTGQPLCPSCKGGRLHPYMVTMSLNFVTGWHGVDYLVGWVAVCVGDRNQRAEAKKRGYEPTFVEPQPPCGFSMQMMPRTYEQDRREREQR